jgi:hypothetical protein
VTFRLQAAWAQEDEAVAANGGLEAGKCAGEEGAELDDASAGVVGRRRVRKEEGDDEE